MNGKIDLHLGN